MSLFKIARRQKNNECIVFFEKLDKTHFFVEMKTIFQEHQICNKCVSVVKEYKINRHYESKHENPEKYTEKVSLNKLKDLKSELLEVQRRMLLNTK